MPRRLLGKARRRAGGSRCAATIRLPISPTASPRRESPEFWYAFDDVVYLFRSAAHREKFAADPERFAPQYDGYCAGGISKGYKVEPDPEAWIVANGRLFVFEFQDRIPMFRKIIDDVAAKANENWPRLRKE